MRRCIFLLIGVMFLCSCQSGAVLRETEFESGKLSVYLPNAHYKETLLRLWERTYPQYKDMLSFVDNQHDADVQYVMDEDIIFNKELFLNIEDITYDAQIPDIQKENVIGDIFLPIQGEGMVFAYNKQLMKDYGVREEQLRRFEKLVNIPNAYYHNHTYDYIYPFLFESSADVSATTYNTICEEISNHALAYFTWYQAMQISDNMLDQATFYNKYLCGLLSSNADYQQSSVYKKGDLHFTSMPTWNGKALHPYVTMHGFVILNTTNVPNLAKGFLTMARSIPGIQAFLDSNVGIPILKEEDLSNYTIYEHDKKEIIVAMNESQCKDLRIMTTSHNQTVFQGFLQSLMTSIIQNATKQDKDVESMNKELIHDQEGLHME